MSLTPRSMRGGGLPTCPARRCEGKPMQCVSGPPLYAKVRSRAAAGRPKAAQRAATPVIPQDSRREERRVCGAPRLRAPVSAGSSMLAAAAAFVAVAAAHRFEIRRRCWLATAGSRNEQRAPSRCVASGGLRAAPGFAAAGGVPWVPLLPFALLLSGVGCCCFSCKLGAAASSFHLRGECRIDAARRRLGFHETDSWC